MFADILLMPVNIKLFRMSLYQCLKMNFVMVKFAINHVSCHVIFCL